MKSLKTKVLEKKDKEASLKVRERDKLCRKCKKAPASQAAHIFSRGHMATRWDLENLLGMCFYCHIMWSHREPVEFTLWVKKEIGEKKFKELEKKSKIVEPINWKELDKSFKGNIK